MKTKNQILGNFLLFYFSWWTIITSMSQKFLWAPAIIFSLAFLIHYTFISNNRKKDLIEMIVIATILTTIDALLYFFNIVFFHYSISNYLPPIWMIFITLLFATTFSYGFSDLRNKLIAQVVLGGILAPITYLTAYRYGLIDINRPFSLYYTIHVAAQMLIIPVCFSISKRLQRN